MLLHFISSLRPRYEGDAGGGTGSGSGSDGKDDARPRASDILERHGSDAIKLAERLATREGDNYALREERRQLKEQLEQLRGQIPAQGAVVLTAEQASTWQTYQQLGAPDALTTQLKERETVQSELASLKQDLTLRDVASVAKYDLDVLRTLGGDLTYTIKDEQVNGKPEKRVYVKDGDKETLLADHAKAQWAKFLPSLQLADATPPRPAIGTPQNRTQPQQPAQGGQAQQPPRKTTVRL